MAYQIKGIDYMRRKLAQKRPRVLTRYGFYDMKNHVRDFHISTPPEMNWFMPVLGWCAKSADSLADRLVFRTMREDNFDMNGIFAMNNPDVLFDSAFLSAIVSSCCFIYISGDEDGFPRLQVIDGANATGEIDTITGLLNEGYAVLQRDESGNAVMEAHFLPRQTIYYIDGRIYQTYTHAVDYPLLVPIINRPDAVRPFGRSRITRACMSIVAQAIRTIKRSEISAEFYSFPQKYVLGLSDDVEIDQWSSAMSWMLTIGKDDDGDKPTAGQFQQQSMTPHTEQVKMFASMFAGETGLTMDDLGFTTDNPASAEAIKAAHENLRLEARKAQRTFGSGLLNVGYISACLRDNFSYKRAEIYNTKPVFEPIFEPDAAAMSGLGDAIIKINQAVPGYLTEDKIRDLLGV